MIPELGHFALIVALIVALAQGILPLAGAQSRNERWIALARPAAGALNLMLLFAFGCLTAAFVQERRGHVGIEALAEILPAGVNRVRRLFVDVASLAFVAFFSWKSWTLLHEAWVDGQVTSSTWGPPLWIPYSLMASGMTLLALQIALQLARGLTEKRA